MKILIVYDSFFGNTEKIAAIIKENIDGAALVKAADATPEMIQGIDLLIVGSPTRAFRPSPDISAFLNSIPAGGLNGLKVAAFDTRADVEKINSRALTLFAKMFGYAAAPIAKALVKKGGALVSPPEGFKVAGTEGPLLEVEMERAVSFAKGVI